MIDTASTILTANPATKRPRKMARDPKPKAVDGAAPTKRMSKTDLVLNLLKRPEGATINQLVEATGWLPHTTRAALTGLKKKGHTVISEKAGGPRRYQVSSGAG